MITFLVMVFGGFYIPLGKSASILYTGIITIVLFVVTHREKGYFTLIRYSNKIQEPKNLVSGYCVMEYQARIYEDIEASKKLLVGGYCVIEYNMRI